MCECVCEQCSAFLNEADRATVKSGCKNLVALHNTRTYKH